jgi:hypothetical protein
MVAVDSPLDEKKKWLFRPYRLASHASLMGVVWLIPAIAFDDIGGTAARIAVAVTMVFIAGCLTWGEIRTENATRGRS